MKLFDDIVKYHYEVWGLDTRTDKVKTAFENKQDEVMKPGDLPVKAIPN